MIRLLAVTAATLLTLTVVSSPGAHAWCDDDCAYEAREAAYERAYEREAAREEAEEEGYYQPQQRSVSKAARRRAKTERAETKKAAQQKQIAEPKPTAPAQSPPRTPRTRVASENSSIASEHDEVAEDDSFGRAPLVREVGCKKFIASAGMTLSAACE